MTSIDMTPGTWIVRDLGGDGYEILAPRGWQNPDGSYTVSAIATVATGLGSEATARLIAAAPAMRDALNLLISMEHGNYERGTMRYERALAQARVAIHLATKGS